MKILKTFIIILAVMMINFFNFSGLGAEPSKPDFAFPKTVSSDAEADLKVAMKSQSGSAIVNALIRYSLAQTAINPENKDKVIKRLEKTESQVNDSVTSAMIKLLKADIEHDDSVAFAVWKEYADVLRNVPVTEWDNVVTAMPQFFPTLYDFAAAKAPLSEVADSMIEYYKNSPLPRLYWVLSRAFSYDLLLEAYKDMQSEPESAFVLSPLSRSAYLIEQRKEVYDLACQWLEAYPSSPYKSDVNAMVDLLCTPSMTIKAASLVGLGKPLQVKVDVRCLNACSVNVEQVKGTGATPYRRLLKFDGSGVFEADSVLELTFNEYGVYRLTPVFTGQSDRRNRDDIEVVVSDIMLWQGNYGKHSQTYALDVINGALQTDVKFENTRNHISATRGKDAFTPSIYRGSYGVDDRGTIYTANVLTDRGLYHPGDSLKFVGVLMESNQKVSFPVVGKKVQVQLKNPNWQIVDTLSLVSDNFGRITGDFKLPSDGLTGNYHIEIPKYGSSFVTVTDYKAPTFEVKAKCERISNTSLRISGTAVGYNGFPIADGDVTIEIHTLPRWVWLRNFRNAEDKKIAADTVCTDSEGRFVTIVDIPESAADESLGMTAIVASPTGETHEAAAFVPARPYYISANIPQYFVPGMEPDVKVLNTAGEVENIPLITELISVADSAIIIPDPKWINVPSGEYSLKIRTEDSAFAEAYESRVYVYRPTDKMPPAEMALFVPDRKLTSGDSLLVGTSYSDSHILKTLWDGERIISQEWLTPAQGNTLVDVTLPDSVRSATLSLATLRNYHTEEINVRIVRRNIPSSLNLKFNSFRDRMVPGERERWTISVADNLGNPVEAAVILDVYSKALDAIRPFSWHFNVYNSFGKVWNLNYSGVYPCRASAVKYVNDTDNLSFTAPRFNLYGRNWPEIMEFEYMVCDSFAPQRLMKRAVSGMGDTNAYPSYDDAESADDAAIGSAADTGAVNGENGATQDDTYRLPEIPVALWAPMLTSAPDGSLQVEFEAPEANTTWKLMCQAYDMSLLHGFHTAEIVAAKPVMVQPNVPRFLRTGDSTDLRAMVMNATDSVAVVNSFIEIFDPVTAEVLGRREFTDTIDAGKSVVITMPLVAPDRSMLGIRMKAASGNFIDGEQSVIAILPAVITARSATPLFFASDSADVIVNAPKGSVVQLTTNAAWECVTALPGLVVSESKGAFASTSALFSAAVGRGLLRTYPQIASALKRWESTDSVLVSKLSKNEDLKIALLSSTPWPAAAQSDSERMGRLLLLFDGKESQKVIDNAVDNLAKLVRKGGIAWTLDSEDPSRWVTEQFLSVMARLRSLGYMPSSTKLERIISEAVKYLDDEVARDYAKYKGGEYPDYTELRISFPEITQSAPAKRAQAATVQYLIAHWRDFGFTGQAQAALILNAGGYQKTARTIIESLRQYEAWRQTGLNAKLLDAFAAVEPQCAEVDEIRQFFIERKQAMEWGDGLATTNLIASILSSGSNWLVPAENEMEIRVNGKEVNPGIETVMGSFRLDLPDGGSVELHKGQFPAWGGIFTCLTDTVTDIPAFESEKLSVSRRIEGELTVGSRIKVIIEINAVQPLDYVVVKSPHAAGMSVVDQLPGRMWLPGSSVYREPCATETNWFFSRLGKGKTIITEEFFVTSEGTFLFAPAEAQSQYSPEFHARTSGNQIVL